MNNVTLSLFIALLLSTKGISEWHCFLDFDKVTSFIMGRLLGLMLGYLRI